MTWRWMAGILAAFISIVFMLLKYALFLRSKHYQFVLHPGSAGNGVLTWGWLWLSAGLCAWSAVMLNGFRFGLRDRLTRVGLGLAMLLLASAWFVELPYASYISPILVALYAALCLGRRSQRAPFFALLTSSLTFMGMWSFLLISLQSLVVATGGPASGVIGGTAEIGFFGVWFLSFVAEAWVLTRTRRWLLPRPQNA